MTSGIKTSGIKVTKRRPTRTCVGCGQRDAQSLLLRLKLSRDGGLSVVSTSGEGRSAYVHENPACLLRLPKTRLLRRSLRADIARPRRQALADGLLRGNTESSPSPQSMKPEA